MFWKVKADFIGYFGNYVVLLPVYYKAGQKKK